MTSAFNFNSWANWAAANSSSSLILVGVLSAPLQYQTGYVEPAVLEHIITQIYSNSQFGGWHSLSLGFSV